MNPPLPVINDPKYGPCLFVDNSMLELLMDCPREFEYNRLWKRIPASENPALNFGRAIHLALEHRYRAYGGDAPSPLCYEDQVEILTKHFAEVLQPEDDFRTLNWACEVVRHYNDHYITEPFSTLVVDDKTLIEMPFALPLTKIEDITIIYIGRIDLPVLWDNQLFIGDHKTTSMLGKMFSTKMRMSPQAKGYAWAFSQCSDKPVAGYWINALRTKEPPQKLGNGTSSRAEVSKWWTESFQRERFWLRPGELDEWKNNTIRLIETMFHHYTKSYFPMNAGNSCARYGGCPYLEVCTLAAQDRAVMLSSGLFTDNNWTPLNEPEKRKIGIEE